MKSNEEILDEMHFVDSNGNPLPKRHSQWVEWIDCKDKMPEANNVLGYSEIGFLGDHYLECYYNSTQNKWYESRRSWQVDIIYWMPLPKPPNIPTINQIINQLLE